MITKGRAPSDGPTTRPATPPCTRAARIANPRWRTAGDDDILHVCEHLAADPGGPLIAVLSLNDGRLRCLQCAGRAATASCAWCGSTGPLQPLVYAVELNCDHDGAPYHHRFYVAGRLCAACARGGGWP